MEQQQGPSERVLVVDDEPVMRDVLSRFLRRSGYEVMEVASVVGALDELMSAARRNQSYDHAVVDLLLKDGDGEDVVRACESLTPRPNIVVVSGNIDSRRALELAGRCLYLPKPIAAKTLLEALRKRKDPIGEFTERYGLSPRERDAILVAVQGLFNEDAADALGVTKEGLRKRWRQICSKTGCTTQQRVLAKIIRDLSDDPARSSGFFPSITSTRPPAPRPTAKRAPG
ncbi:MAG TPA: response regulator [Polyangiaceae bacterium]|nr:response regulator [Polyangiaceae bacterium]